MAVRLSVLILRPIGDLARWDAACDRVVGNVLGRPGLDVVLLDRLPVTESGTTENLAVESLSGDLACITWLDAESLQNQLAAAGTSFVRWSHTTDPFPTPSERTSSRLFFFDMKHDGAEAAILEDLKRLLGTLQVPTFQLRLGPVEKAKTERKTSANESPGVAVHPEPAKPSMPTAEVSVDSSMGGPRNEEESDELQSLVDELDSLDL